MVGHGFLIAFMFSICCVEAIYVVNAVLWQPEQTQNTQNRDKPEHRTTIIHGCPRAIGLKIENENHIYQVSNLHLGMTLYKPVAFLNYCKFHVVHAV